jgi:hypothetical protein
VAENKDLSLLRKEHAQYVDDMRKAYDTAKSKFRALVDENYKKQNMSSEDVRLGLETYIFYKWLSPVRLNKRYSFDMF